MRSARRTSETDQQKLESPDSKSETNSEGEGTFLPPPGFAFEAQQGKRTMTKLIEKDPVHTIEEDDIRPPPHYQEDGPPQIVTADTARQAPRGTPVLYVLLAALILSGLVWVVVAEFVY